MWTNSPLCNFLSYKGYSLVGWILGALFCESIMLLLLLFLVCLFFLFFKRDQKSLARLIFLITQDCPPRQSKHNELFFPHSLSPSVCLSLTLPPIFSLILASLSHFAVSFQSFLFWGPKLARNIFLIKLVGARSEQLTEKNNSLACYSLDEKHAYCLRVILLIIV